MQPEFLPLGDTRNYYEDEVILCFKGSTFLGPFNPTDEELKTFRGKKYTNKVLSDKKLKKFFVPFAYQFGHFFTDTLSAILLNVDRDMLENKKTTLIVPPTGPFERNNLTGAIQAISYISDYLSRTNVSVEAVPGAETDEQIIMVSVVNLELQSLVSFNSWSMKRVREFCRSLPHVSALRGDKKIYLSREKTPDTTGVNFREICSIRGNPEYFPPNYPRVSNEVELIEYLEKDCRISIEKVVPEEFESFQDQIRLFSETDVLISPTSSSLFNMLFMPENSTVIELVTPLTVWDSDKQDYVTAYHNHYSLLSFVCGINYIGLPHSRDVKEVIDKLDRYVF